MIICPKCNHDNELGRIFCSGCGERLDLSMVQSPGQLKKARQKSNPFIIIKKVLHIGFWVVFLVVGYLMWQSPVMKDIAPVEADLEAAEDKIGEILDAAKTGDPLIQPIDLTEAQIAAFIDKKTQYKTADSGFNLAVSKIRLEFDTDQVTAIVFLTANVSTNKHDFIAKYTGVVTVKDGKLTSAPQNISVGKCPIPGFMSGLITNKLGELADIFNEQLSAVGKQGQIKAVPGKIIIGAPPA